MNPMKNPNGWGGARPARRTDNGRLAKTTSRVVSVQIPLDVFNFIRAAARDEGVSVSKVARRALRRGLPYAPWPEEE